MMIGAQTTEATMKEGQKVRTIYGQVETIMLVEESRIVTFESARRNTWYHPTKVFVLS